MGASQNYNVNLNINANAQSAQQQLQKLQQQLHQIANMQVNVGTDAMKNGLEEASQAALKLSSYLQQATNVQTGNLDFSKLNNSINKSNMSLQQYGESLRKLGPQGEQAYMGLAQAIAKSEIPLRRTSELTQKMWDGFKRTAGWQLQSSLIHGIIGGVQQAVGYAKDLNKSLTDIRIVTGSSADEMARFAQRANDAAKKLSTTTTDYTRASLIYYQQGLSEAEVEARAKATIKMANATGTSAQEVSNQMTAIWNNYADGSKSLTHYADVMTALGAATASSTDEIAQGLQKFASISNTVGLSYEYAASALATITAESRESADVVGNALKTLFSRIQGLQLGETLDDGTTLNKYSTALSKVGISIKDQTGGLKDMDDILNEMGSKWDTLARDEKMALAQTVAGVRQYTQLMTLMENWDDFKQNLNTANTSTGTLDNQAAIYAESWEAASDRVRASWEGLWDNLISSDGFITILDGLSGIVQFLDKMVTGLGGAGGALLTFGGIMTSVFNKQISTSISNAAYGIKMMMPGQYNKVVAERESFIKTAQDTLGKDTLLSLGREQEFKVRRDDLNSSLNASLLYSRNKDFMSADQHLMENQYASSLETINKNRLNTAIELDKSIKQQDSFKYSLSTKKGDYHSPLYDSYDSLNVKNIIENKKNVANASIKNYNEKIEAIEKQLYTKQSINQRKQNKDFKLIERNDISRKQKESLNAQIKTLQQERQRQINWRDSGLEQEMQSYKDKIFNSQENQVVQDAIKNGIENYTKTINDLQQNNPKLDLDKGKFEEGSTEAEAQKEYRLAKQNLEILQNTQKTQGAGKNIQNFNDALTAQAQGVAKLNKMFGDMGDTANAEKLLAGLSDFSSTASNSMQSSDFITQLTNLAKGKGAHGEEVSQEEYQKQYQQLKNQAGKFANEAMDTVSGAIYDTLSSDPEFNVDGKQMSREDFVKEARTYLDTEQGKLKLQELTARAQEIQTKREENLKSKQKIQSGAQALVSGAQGAMQALAAGEAFKSLVNSLSEGTATLTSTLTGLTSALTQGAMGFSGLNTALGSISSLSAGAAAGIAGVAVAILSLLPVAVDFIDKMQVNSKELKQNLVTSDNELTEAANTSKEKVEQFKTQNENYLSTVQKIESLNYDPSNMAEDIYQANKQALDLIHQYGLRNNQYTTAENGLIKIDKTILDKEVEKQQNLANSASYAEIIGKALNAADLSKLTSEDYLAEAKEIFNLEKGEVLSNSINAPGVSATEKINKERINELVDISFEDAYQAWKENGDKWEEYTNKFGEVDWNEIAQAFKDNADAQREATHLSKDGLLNALSTVVTKTLTNQGYSSDNKSAYGAYVRNIATQAQENAQNLLFRDPKNGAQLSQAEEDIVRQYLEQQGVHNAGLFKVENGQISYQAEGDTNRAQVMISTLNGWYAENQLSKQIDEYTKIADQKWNDYSEIYGDATEAVLHNEEFGTLNGASFSSVRKLFTNKENNADYTNYTDQLDNKQYYKDTIAFAEDVIGEENLDKMGDSFGFGAVEALMNSIKPESMGLFQEMFNSIANIPGMTGENLAGMFTLLSSMNFNDTNFSNFNTIKSGLEDLGLLDQGSLPEIYSYLSGILGLSPPGESSKSNVNKMVEAQGVLNSIKPGQSVDEQTKIAAEASGLQGKFEKDASGYTYTGTQEEIDNAVLQSAKEQASEYSKWKDIQGTIEKTEGRRKSYSDVNDFKLGAMNQKIVPTETTEFATGEKDIYKINDTLNKLGLSYDFDSKNFKDENGNIYEDSDQGYNRITNRIKQAEAGGKEISVADGQALFTQAQQSSTVTTQTEKIEGNAGRDDNQALLSFMKGQGVNTDNLSELTDSDWEQYMNLYNDVMSQTGSFDLSQLNARQTMDLLDSGTELDTKTVVDHLRLYDETSERLKNARENWESSIGTEQEAEAQKQYDLALSIEEVAAARELDADVLAHKVAALQQNEEYINSTTDSLTGLAAEILEQQSDVENLSKSYDDLSSKIKKNDKTSDEWRKSMVETKKLLAKILNIKDWESLSDGFIEAAEASGLLAKAAEDDEDAISDLMRYSALAGKAIDKGLITGTDLAAKGFSVLDEKISDLNSKTILDEKEKDFLTFANNINTIMDGIKPLKVGEIIPAGDLNEQVKSALTDMGAVEGGFSALQEAALQYGLTPILTPVTAEEKVNYVGLEGQQLLSGDPNGSHTITNDVHTLDVGAMADATLYKISYAKTGGGGGGSTSSKGGGGGGGKEPKKTAQSRRSQTVKRYKNIDAKRSTNQNRRNNLSKKTDKVYGEARITNLQKENKLLEEGLRLNEKKAEEALKNLKVDEESLRTMTKKYGYELELDSEGNIKNYEKILGDIYDQIHELEADGELSEEEEKIKEELEIKKQEVEGAMEDWEDTLKQLEELNNEYEELIDEMHSNELEQITYKLEFELELNELDTEWYDFLNEQIGDDFTQAVDIMDLITEKIKIANDNINLYKQSVTDLMENIENDPNRSLITGYLEDGVLTDEEAEILKEAYSGIIEQLSALAEAKTSAEELLVSIFEGYKERIDFDTTALEHYTSLLEHFGNVVDIVGQKQLGLSDQFMENMAKMRIQQSKDVMSAVQSELAAYEQIRAEAEEELTRAREEGRTNDIDYWQQQLDEANTSIQEARDKLVTSFEDNLNAIADAFDKAVERIVQTFNDAVYAFGGLEGLSEDYSFIRENTELMAQDYEKIYELSKLNRNINKTLNDNNIIAGKQKMIELQKEINDLQASGAELSKYDLEYLQAKYELRLAEIELENAQNAKETVRLSKDSEGNWSYVYTASTEKIDEAQQKYEDALYKMQNLSYEYIDEMSEKIISASQAMMEEIQNLNKNNFENEQEYLAEINRIKAKYAESLGVTEEELNKALANNEELYDKDWQSYSNKTGYVISESQNWIDRYAESTLGTLMKSTSDVADYMNNFSIALDELTNSIYRVAGDYYNGIDDAFAAAGITKEEFASFVTTNTKAIMDASTNTKKDIETQTSTLVKEYRVQADKVTDIQRILDTAIDVYGPYIREIRDILKESAALTKEQQNKDATYTYKQAADLFNSKYGEDYKIEMDAEGRWKKTVEGVKNEILQKHAEAKTDEEKKHYADMYTWLTSYILPYVTSLDTGGYTGEWGTSGRLAMLHEKELILNANDTANFLDALNVSRELVNRVIEMNARASSFGIGGLSPSSIQDFAQNLEQQVTITAEFPNAVDHNEIEEAFASLINTASQYANRK